MATLDPARLPLQSLPPTPHSDPHVRQLEVLNEIARIATLDPRHELLRDPGLHRDIRLAQAEMEPNRPERPSDRHVVHGSDLDRRR